MNTFHETAFALQGPDGESGDVGGFLGLELELGALKFGAFTFTRSNVRGLEAGTDMNDEYWILDI